MANSFTGSSAEIRDARLRAWVMGLGLSAIVMLGGGFALAAFVDGPAQLWTGLTYVVAVGLAIIVGLSKTSSA